MSEDEKESEELEDEEEDEEAEDEEEKETSPKTPSRPPKHSLREEIYERMRERREEIRDEEEIIVRERKEIPPEPSTHESLAERLAALLARRRAASLRHPPGSPPGSNPTPPGVPPGPTTPIPHRGSPPSSIQDEETELESSEQQSAPESTRKVIEEAREELERKRLEREREEVQRSVGTEIEDESPSVPMLCRQHSRQIIYDHLDLVWKHSDDKSHCEELDQLPTTEGFYIESLESITLRKLATAQLDKSTALRLANEWIRKFISNDNLEFLQEKWPLVLIAATLGSETSPNYENVGATIKRNIERFARDLVLITTIDFIEQHEKIVVIEPSEQAIIESAHKIAQYLLSYWEVIDRDTPPGSTIPKGGTAAFGHSTFMSDLKSSPLFQRQKMRHGGPLSRMTRFVSDVKAKFDVGVLDRESLLTSVIGKEDSWILLIEQIKNIWEMEQAKKLAKKHVTKDLLSSFFRRLLDLEAFLTLEELLGYIGIIGIALSRDVLENRGFSIELLSLEHLRIARWVAWATRNLFPAMGVLRVEALETRELWVE